MVKRLDDVLLAIGILCASTIDPMLGYTSFAFVMASVIVFLVKGYISKFSPILSILTLILCAIYLQPGTAFLLSMFLIFIVIFIISVMYGD